MTFVEKRNLKLLLFATWRTSGYSLCWAVILWLSRSWIISPVPVRGPVRWWWPAGSAWVKVPYWRSVRGLVARKTSTRWDKTHWRQNVVFRKKIRKMIWKNVFSEKSSKNQLKLYYRSLLYFVSDPFSSGKINVQLWFLWSNFEGRGASDPLHERRWSVFRTITLDTVFPWINACLG